MVEIRTTKVERHRALDFLTNAEEALWAARECCENGKYTPAVIIAVHASISANDALGVWISAARCSSEKHEDAADFLRRLDPANPDYQQNAKRLSSILGHKHASEYMGSRFTEREARAILQDAERLLAFVRSQIKTN